MIIRLGFVSMAMAIFNNTPSSTFTYKLFSQRPREEAMQRAIDIGRKNLAATLRILYYNAAHGIRLFRLSSSLIPLATHPDVQINVAGENKRRASEAWQLREPAGNPLKYASESFHTA
ncbi:UV-damage endonuclease [Paenibacillus sp. yr247]|uniref:hypothetical protein n=1 Tax=Paenibacillus sp. yr247 TaxID=1761880 RepID=UPI00087EBEA0|nr:hypothetical protein [Paenibacillus sp. yr247]SDO72644.1 UV-damage endonuclease [Paenibacillus sp. yr247]